MIVIEETFGRPLQDPKGEEERFERGEPCFGIGAIGLAARIGGSEMIGEAAPFAGLGEALLHFVCEAPGSVDEKEPSCYVCRSERGRVDFEEEIGGEIGERILRVGEEEKIRPVF